MFGTLTLTWMNYHTILSIGWLKHWLIISGPSAYVLKGTIEIHVCLQCEVCCPHLHSKVLLLCTFSTGPGTCQEPQGSASAHWHQPFPEGLETAPSPCLHDQTDLLQHTSDKPREATILHLEDTQTTVLNSTWHACDYFSFYEVRCQLCVLSD